MTSSPGILCGPFHSTMRGRRPRRPSSASRKARPFEKAEAKDATNGGSVAEARTRSHAVGDTCLNSGGHSTVAFSASEQSIPSAVPISVSSVRV